MYSVAQHDKRPFFVMQDSSYNRMHNKLKNGSRFEWSFMQAGCTKDANGNCICPKFMNVLKDDTIIRISEGKQKPVYKASEFEASQKEGTRVMCLYASKAQENSAAYLSFVKELINDMFKVNRDIQVEVVLDGDGWSGARSRATFQREDKEKLMKMAIEFIAMCNED